MRMMVLTITFMAALILFQPSILSSGGLATYLQIHRYQPANVLANVSLSTCKCIIINCHDKYQVPRTNEVDALMKSEKR